MIDFGIKESMQNVDNIIQTQYPKILANLANDIFASGGKSHGRDWADNTPSTIKRKGGNSPNIESGQLEDWLSTEGNILDDDYMSRLPSSTKVGNWGDNGYLYANSLRKFDDIGRTEQDEKYIENELANKIKEQLA
jgi:hypothetical protein